MDRDPGAGDRQRRHLCAGPRASRTQQGPRAATNDHAECGARSGVVPQVRLCAVAHLDPVECPHHPLLSMPGLRCLAPPGRAGLRQPPGAAGSARPGRLGRDHQAARDPQPDPGRTRSTVGGGAHLRSDAAAPESPRTRSGAAPQEHGPVADRLPGRADLARRAAPADTGVAAAGAGHPRRAAVDHRPDQRPRHLSTPGRNPGRVPHPVALIGGDPRRS